MTNEHAGQQASRVLRGVPLKFADRAGPCQRQVAGVLRQAGFSVTLEWPVEDYGYDGYIDVLAEKSGGAVAIEIDRHRPRIKSIKKLNLLPFYRLICLRGIEWAAPPGIDDIVALRVWS